MIRYRVELPRQNRRFASVPDYPRLRKKSITAVRWNGHCQLTREKISTTQALRISSGFLAALGMTANCIFPQTVPPSAIVFDLGWAQNRAQLLHPPHRLPQEFPRRKERPSDSNQPYWQSRSSTGPVIRLHSHVTATFEGGRKRRGHSFRVGDPPDGTQIRRFR